MICERCGEIENIKLIKVRDLTILHLCPKCINIFKERINRTCKEFISSCELKL